MFEDMAKRVAVTFFLSAAFFQMALCQDVEKKKLQCYYCGYERACVDNSVQCQEGEKCSTMLGHSDYKVHESISGKGCISGSKCGSQDRLIFWHNPFRVTYSCCDTDYCNSDGLVVAGAGHTSLSAHLPWLLAATLLATLPALLS